MPTLGLRTTVFAVASVGNCMLEFGAPKALLILTKLATMEGVSVFKVPLVFEINVSVVG